MGNQWLHKLSLGASKDVNEPVLRSHPAQGIQSLILDCIIVHQGGSNDDDGLSGPAGLETQFDIGKLSLGPTSKP